MGLPQLTKSKFIQELCEDLHTKGFTFERGGNHWKVYSPTGQFVQPIPGTLSDYRGELNWRSDIRKFLRINNYPPLESDVKLKNKPFAVALAPEEPSTPPQEPVEHEVDFKTLKDDDFDHVLRLYEAKGTWTAVAEIISAQGYRSRVGTKLGASNLSAWMQVRGWVNPNLGTRGGEVIHVAEMPKVEDKPVPVESQPRPEWKPPLEPHVIPKNLYPLLSEVTEIVSSNLADAMKEKMLGLIFKG